MSDNALSVLRGLRKLPDHSLKQMDSEALTTAAFYLTDLDKSTSGHSGKVFDSMRETIHEELEGRGVELDFDDMGQGPFSGGK